MDWVGLELDAKAATPLYLQLCNGLSDLMVDGKLQPGDQLPSERKLAEQLSVSRTTAVNAYHELEARGLVRSYIGRGTFVSSRPERMGAHFAWRGKVTEAVQQSLDMSIRSLIELDAADTISFGAGQPNLESFPVERYQALSNHILTNYPRAALGFLPTEGHPHLREVLAQREGVRPEEILVVTGTQQALDLISRCLLSQHDSVVMDWPGYIGAIQSFRFAGAHLCGWDFANGDLDELEDIFLKKRPKLLYINPTFQNPTGATLPLEARQGIIQLARNYRVPIVEDEAYRDMYFTEPPPPTLKDLEGTGLVIHLRTFSKTLAPGVRLGYVVADEAIIDQLSLVKAQSDLFNPGLSQLCIATLVDEGDYDKNLQFMRTSHQQRARAMEKSLKEYLPANSLHWQSPKGGLYLWAHLRDIEAQALQQAAARHGVSFASGDKFFPDKSGKRSMRLVYSSTSQQRIVEGVKRIAAAYEEIQK